MHHRSVAPPLTPGALAPVRVMLSRSFITYRPHAPLSSAHLDFTDTAYTRCPRCASYLRRLGDQRVVPCFRRLFFIGMSSSATPGSPSAACTQFLRRRHWPCDALVRVSALPTPPALRFSPGKPISGLHYSSLSLQPADLLASLVGADQRLPSSQPRLLLPGFQRLDRSHRCRIWLRCGNWASSTDDRGRDTGRPVRRVGPGSCRVGRGISAPAPHRTVRDALTSYGSCHLPHPAGCPHLL